MINSEFLNINNRILNYFQNKLSNISKKSIILCYINEIILFFIGLTLFASTFLQSERIGLIAIIIVFLTILKLLTQKGAKLYITKFDGALILYIIICFISTINSTLVQQSLHGFFKTIIYIAYYFCVANYFQTNQNRIKWIFLLVAGLCSFEGIIALIQNIGGVEQIATWQDTNYINPEDAIARAYGTLKPYNPNLLGGYLLASIPYLIGTTIYFLLQKNKKISIISISMCIISSYAVFVTGSRGAYLGLGAIVAGFIAIVTIIINTNFGTISKLKEIWQKIVLTMISAFTLILIAVPKITKRLLSIFILRGDSSTSFRMNVYNSSWQMFCDNWFLGIGAGNQTFREIYGLYMLTGFDALSTYSVPLEIAVESGILGFIAFLTFILWFLFDGIRYIRTTNNTNDLVDKIIVSSAILLIIGVMTHGLFDTIFYRPQVQFLFWTILAISSATIKKLKLSEV